MNTKPGTTTLPPVIAAMNAQINIDYSVIAASGFLGALPAVILVLVFQRYLVQGLTAASVKGERPTYPPAPDGHLLRRAVDDHDSVLPDRRAGGLRCWAASSGDRFRVSCALPLRDAGATVRPDPGSRA
jgi:hypothetical protein